MAPTRLVLIRHGESQAMIDRIVSGHETCAGLSDHGRDQAARLRERLLRTGELRDAAAVYTSILPRAMETAALIAPAVGNGELVAVAHCDWCEQHAGEGEGLSLEDYDARFGLFNEGFERDRVRAPGSENIETFVSRIDRALARTVDDHDGQTVVIVCHGGVVTCALEALVGIPFGSLVPNVDNTAMVELRRDDAGPWLLTRFNDASHLF